MLGLLTSFVERKPLLSLLSIGSSSGSVESSGDWQMTLELMNEASSESHMTKTLETP